MLKLINVEKKLKRQTVLRGVTLDVAAGENMVIIGRSGGGKSVLLRHIMGLWQPDKGEVWFEGQNLATLTEEKLMPVRREMGMLFQNGALFDSMTIGDNVAFSLREDDRQKLTETEIRQEVARALKTVDLAGQEHKMPAEISGGMRKRVALARAAIRKPKLMMYDEPTAGLDPIISDSINKLILRLGQEFGMAAIVVTHDMTSAYAIADRIAMLHEGRIYFVGKPEEVRQSTDSIITRFVQGISQESDAVF